MGEWVDITDGQNTKRYKRIKMAIFIIKIGIFVFFIIECIAIGEVLKMLSQYVEDSSLILETALTNSQITAIISMLVLGGVLFLFAKMIGKVIKW